MIVKTYANNKLIEIHDNYSSFKMIGSSNKPYFSIIQTMITFHNLIDAFELLFLAIIVQDRCILKDSDGRVSIVKVPHSLFLGNLLEENFLLL